MSKANSPIKVLKTAIKRLNKGWVKSQWSDHNPDTGVTSVCLEGAIFRFCQHAKTPQQKEALQACEQIILERWVNDEFKIEATSPERNETAKKAALESGGRGVVPLYNDRVAQTSDEMVEICKLAIIRLETGGPIEDDEFIEFDPDSEELEDLLPKKS